MNHTDDTIIYTKPKTMKYRVKTRQLKSFNRGDVVEKRNSRYWLVTDNKNHCLSLPAAMVENTDWFEPVEEKIKDRFSVEVSESGFTIWDDEAKKWVIDGSIYLSDGILEISKRAFDRVTYSLMKEDVIVFEKEINT